MAARPRKAFKARPGKAAALKKVARRTGPAQLIRVQELPGGPRVRDIGGTQERRIEEGMKAFRGPAVPYGEDEPRKKPAPKRPRAAREDVPAGWLLVKGAMAHGPMTREEAIQAYRTHFKRVVRGGDIRRVQQEFERRFQRAYRKAVDARTTYLQMRAQLRTAGDARRAELKAQVDDAEQVYRVAEDVLDALRRTQTFPVPVNRKGLLDLAASAVDLPTALRRSVPEKARVGDLEELLSAWLDEDPSYVVLSATAEYDEDRGWELDEDSIEVEDGLTLRDVFDAIVEHPGTKATPGWKGNVEEEPGVRSLVRVFRVASPAQTRGRTPAGEEPEPHLEQVWPRARVAAPCSTIVDEFAEVLCEQAGIAWQYTRKLSLADGLREPLLHEYMPTWLEPRWMAEKTRLPVSERRTKSELRDVLLDMFDDLVDAVVEDEDVSPAEFRQVLLERLEGAVQALEEEEKEEEEEEETGETTARANRSADGQTSLLLRARTGQVADRGGRRNGWRRTLDGAEAVALDDLVRKGHAYPDGELTSRGRQAERRLRRNPSRAAEALVAGRHAATAAYLEDLLVPVVRDNRSGYPFTAKPQRLTDFVTREQTEAILIRPVVRTADGRVTRPRVYVKRPTGVRAEQTRDVFDRLRAQVAAVTVYDPRTRQLVHRPESAGLHEYVDAYSFPGRELVEVTPHGRGLRRLGPRGRALAHRSPEPPPLPPQPTPRPSPAAVAPATASTSAQPTRRPRKPVAPVATPGITMGQVRPKPPADEPEFEPVWMRRRPATVATATPAPEETAKARPTREKGGVRRRRRVRSPSTGPGSGPEEG